MRTSAIRLSTILVFLILATNLTSFAYFRSKPLIDFSRITYGSEFIKLDYDHFTRLTGKRSNAWDRLSFGIMKMKVKIELKKNPDYKISSYYEKMNRRSTVFKILSIVVLAVLVLMLIIALIFSGQKK